VTSFLADYGQWALAVTGVASVLFVLAATFLEFSGHRWFLFRGIRVRYFRWWRHELTAAQVMLDLGLGVVLLPSSLYILFKINILNRSSETTLSMWYYAIGLTYVAAVTIWRADATMRAKARERRRMEEEERHPEESPTGRE
jgi:cytochrome c biogenesis protein CcdA